MEKLRQDNLLILTDVKTENTNKFVGRFESHEQHTSQGDNRDDAQISEKDTQKSYQNDKQISTHKRQELKERKKRDMDRDTERTTQTHSMFCFMREYTQNYLQRNTETPSLPNLHNAPCNFYLQQT